ncbi:MAG: hypothetical protein WDN45_01900 [Caulobacteraceae bacterium]
MPGPIASSFCPHPHDLHLLGRGQGEQAHGPRLGQELGPLVAVGSLHRAGKLVGAAGDDHGDLTLQVQALEVVVAEFRQVQAVADEHQGRIDCRGPRRAAGGDQHVRPGLDRLFRPARPDQDAAALGVIDALLLEPDRLQEAAVLARRRQPQGLEAADHIVSRQVESLGAGLAALGLVVGYGLDVAPPLFGARRRGLGADGQGGQERE